jgi:hypothetical protein
MFRPFRPVALSIVRPVALSIGLLAAACSHYDQTVSVAPVPASPVAVSYVAPVAAVAPVTTHYVVMPAPEQSCVDYGFIAGTSAYGRCVTRYAQARSLGRMHRDYAYSRIVADSRDACFSYGLESGTERYDRCVSREIDARQFRDEANLLPLPAPTPAVQYTSLPAYSDQRVATTGVPVFRDEYGFRYDSQGNRIDRFGNIISPQSTMP